MVSRIFTTQLQHRQCRQPEFWMTPGASKRLLVSPTGRGENPLSCRLLAFQPRLPFDATQLNALLGHPPLSPRSFLCQLTLAWSCEQCDPYKIPDTCFAPPCSPTNAPVRFDPDIRVCNQVQTPLSPCRLSHLYAAPSASHRRTLQLDLRDHHAPALQTSRKPIRCCRCWRLATGTACHPRALSR